MGDQLPFELIKRWKIFPCNDDKTPRCASWPKDATDEPAKITDWIKRLHPNKWGIPMAINHAFAVDIDMPDGEITWNEWIGQNGGSGAGISQITPSGGVHLIYALPEGVRVPNNARKIGKGIDLRSDGYICTGDGYTWQDGRDYTGDLNPAPEWLLDKIRAMTKKREVMNMRISNTAPGDPSEAGNYWLRRAVSLGTPGNRNQAGFDLALQLRDSGLSKAEAAVYMKGYASRVTQVAGDPYTEREALESMNAAYKGTPREPAKIPGTRKRAYMENEKETQVMEDDNDSHLGEFLLDRPVSTSGYMVLKRAPDKIMIKPTTGKLPEPYTGDRFNDDSNARYLLSLFGDHMRYVRAWGWVIWDGTRWVKRADHMAMQLAKAAGRNLYKEAATQSEDRDAKKLARHANKSLSAYDLKASLTLAASEVTCEADEFDKDKFLMNLENGILDLRTGNIMPHYQAGMLTKMALTRYDPEAKCPKWDAFLLRVMDGKKHMVDFLQRAVGYSLTGSLGEQAIFFLYGGGANGKSTFIKTILDMMGDYADQAPANFLTNPGRFDTARLVGTRFCATVEVTEGRNLAEAVVKMLTGGDRITAEFKNKDPFSADNTFKIWMAANHKPPVKNNDEAIWRRIKLIPFTVTIPEREQNHNLLDELRDEFPGILNWAVQGCLEWQKNGIQYPDEVKRATAEYRADSDVIGQFINERCNESDELSAPLKDLFTAYLVWAEANKERTDITNNSFSRRMEERGFTKKKESTGVRFYGIGLKNDRN